MLHRAWPGQRFRWKLVLREGDRQYEHEYLG